MIKIYKRVEFFMIFLINENVKKINFQCDSMSTRSFENHRKNKNKEKFHQTNKKTFLKMSQFLR